MRKLKKEKYFEKREELYKNWVVALNGLEAKKAELWADLYFFSNGGLLEGEPLLGLF